MPTLQEIMQQSQQRQQSQATPQPPAGGQTQKLQDLLRARSSGKQLTGGASPQMSTLQEKQAGVSGQQMIQQQRGQEQVQQQASTQQAAAQEQQMAGQEAETKLRGEQIQRAHQSNMLDLAEELRQAGDKLSTEEAGEKLRQLVAEKELSSKELISNEQIASAKNMDINASDASRELAKNRLDSLIENTRDREKYLNTEAYRDRDMKEIIGMMDINDKITALKDWKRTQQTIGIFKAMSQSAQLGGEALASAPDSAGGSTGGGGGGTSTSMGQAGVTK